VCVCVCVCFREKICVLICMQSSCVVVLIQSKQVNFMLKVQNESGLNQKCLTKKILHK